MAVNINIPSEVSQEINFGVTDKAPSESAVLTALDLKVNYSELALVATTGEYDDLINKPTIPAAQVNSDWNATSGVEKILNKPSIPAAQIQSDWNQATTSALDYIKNKPSIPSIAGLVPDSRNLTINGVSYDLTADRSWTIAATASLLQHEVKAGEIMTKGQAVYVSSADGTNMIVTKASNATEATSSKTMGLIAQNLANNGKGYVITEGLLSGLNTAAAVDGDPVWLGTGGNLIFGLANKPSAPAHLVFIGIVTRANVSNGEIFVRVQNGFELQELHNVAITSVADNNLLQYDSATSLWKNESLATAGIQPTLTSGTNIKTINSTSLLGSGDVTVQPTLISGTSIKTINGTTLLGSGDITVGGGITVGTTAVTSGTIGRVFFQGTGNVVQQDSALFYDNTNKRLGLGVNGNTPTSTLFVRTNTTTAHDTFILQNGQYGNPIFRVRDNATASQSSIGSLFIAARIYGSNSTVTGNELDLGGYGLGASYGDAATNAVWLNNQGNNGDGAGTSIISVTSNVFVNNQTTKKYKFETLSGHFGIGQVGTLGARLDVKSQGALSTDFALRVRNSADTSNLFVVKGNGVLNAANMPTSAVGLVTGDIYSNLGILTIV